MNKLTDKEREKCHWLAAKLVTAFDWSSTPEGDEYWGAVYDRLLTMSDPPEEDAK